MASSSTDAKGQTERLPVNAGNDVVHSKGRVVVIILLPDATAGPDAIIGAVESVVERDDNGE